MPMNNNNNNQKARTAAGRLAGLPVLRSAGARLWLLYAGTKRSHPGLRCVCEALESSAAAAGTAACSTVSPVMVKLEPQISIANDVACKGLDWLETRFTVLHTPTEQIVATAKNKIHEIQDVVSIAANGTVDCVQHTLTWLMGRTQPADDPADLPLLQRALSVASVGLDSALIMSETMMDRVLPPTEEEKEEAVRLLEGFEADTLRGSYPARLVSLAAKLCTRTYHMFMENLSRSSGLVQDLQSGWLTLAWSVQGLPQYVQHQLVSVFFLISQMYNLSCPPSQSNQDKIINAAETSPHKDVVQIHPEATSTCRKRRPTKISVFENGCNVKGCVRR